jgi:hypothetical protein
MLALICFLPPLQIASRHFRALYSTVTVPPVKLHTGGAGLQACILASKMTGFSR